jgi:hypothetical protein
MTVNAALRAKKLVYAQVGWYRGGMESWKAANLLVGAGDCQGCSAIALVAPTSRLTSGKHEPQLVPHFRLD